MGLIINILVGPRIFFENFKIFSPKVKMAVAQSILAIFWLSPSLRGQIGCTPKKKSNFFSLVVGQYMSVFLQPRQKCTGFISITLNNARYFFVKTQCNSTQSNSKVTSLKLDTVAMCSPPTHLTTTTNFSPTPRTAKKLKFGTYTN